MNKIATDELRRMNNSEGLILQGCGGNLQEWVDGINELLTEAGILQGGTKFKAEDCSSFEHKELTNLLFPFSDDVKLDMGKLALWRLQTHEQFGGTWLSDYVPLRLGGFVSETAKKQIKPDCALIDEDGNIFNLMGIAARTLRENGLPEQAKAMCDRVTLSGSYYDALSVIGEYVNIVSDEDYDLDRDEDMGGMSLE